MNPKMPVWLVLGLIFIPVLACTLPGQSTLSTATPAGVVNGSGINQGGGNTQPDKSLPTTPPTPQQTLTASPTPSPSPTPTLSPTPTPQGSGPFLVKQIMTLGHETISGIVCIEKPFFVSVAAPEITFNFNFIPANNKSGNWTYAYTLSKAGESHDAKGTYTIKPTKEGPLLLSMTGRDHVVFKGFDGNVPSRYSFDLVPADNAACP